MHSDDEMFDGQTTFASKTNGIGQQQQMVAKVT